MEFEITLANIAQKYTKDIIDIVKNTAINELKDLNSTLEGYVAYAVMDFAEYTTDGVQIGLGIWCLFYWVCNVY